MIHSFSNKDTVIENNLISRSFINKEVPYFDCAHFMAREILNVESLFTNIPLEKTIKICVYKLFQNKMKVDNLLKESFRSLLELATLDSLIFHGRSSRKMV